jgi:hypothetical protein
MNNRYDLEMAPQEALSSYFEAARSKRDTPQS